MREIVGFYSFLDIKRNSNRTLIRNKGIQSKFR